MKISITCITPVLQAILDFFPDIISFQHVFHLGVGRSQIEWKLKVKTQISVFPWANIGQNDHSNPYIESTTVLSDIYIYIHVTVKTQTQCFDLTVFIIYLMCIIYIYQYDMKWTHEIIAVTVVSQCVAQLVGWRQLGPVVSMVRSQALPVTMI